MAKYWIEDSFFDNHHTFSKRFQKDYYDLKKVGRANELTIEANDKKYPVYVIELFMLLTSKEVPYHLLDMMPGSGTFDGWQFVNDYVKGFDNGTEYFKNTYPAIADILLNNYKVYIDTLHLCYYHKAPDQKNIGWGYWVNSYPNTVDAKTIEQYGFYAGIHFSIDLLKQKYPVPFKDFDVCPEQKEGVNNTQSVEEIENDFTLSTIEDWLFEFKELMTKPDYDNLVLSLVEYFDTGVFPKLSKPIKINGKPNIKFFGWHLNMICKAKGIGITKELLLFAKQNISLFADAPFDENNFRKGNFYKYFTTKTK